MQYAPPPLTTTTPPARLEQRLPHPPIAAQVKAWHGPKSEQQLCSPLHLLHQRGGSCAGGVHSVRTRTATATYLGVANASSALATRHKERPLHSNPSAGLGGKAQHRLTRLTQFSKSNAFSPSYLHAPAWAPVQSLMDAWTL